MLEDKIEVHHVHELSEITGFQIALQSLPICCVHKSGPWISKFVALQGKMSYWAWPEL